MPDKLRPTNEKMVEEIVNAIEKEREKTKKCKEKQKKQRYDCGINRFYLVTLWFYHLIYIYIYNVTLSPNQTRNNLYIERTFFVDKIGSDQDQTVANWLLILQSN